VTTTIGFAGQFGGPELVDIIFPHSRALRTAAKSAALSRFPLPELAFILRVDGTVGQYDLSGPGNLDFDKRGKWVSVDIGMTIADRARLAPAPGGGVLAEGILASVDFLRESGDPRLAGADWDELTTVLGELCARYEREIGGLV
jgi:hypothetical protein